MYIDVVLDKVIWTVNWLHYLNQKQTNIQHQVPSNRIRRYRTRKDTERRPKEKKKTLHNNKINGRASARNKKKKKTEQRLQETKTNDKIEY